MIEFDALKKNWQNQKPAGNTNIDIDKIAGESLSKLKKFEKKQFRINLAKTATVILLFIFLIWTMLFATPASIIKIFAVLWLVISTAIFFTVYLKIQLNVDKLNVRENSLEFIDDVLENFSVQKKLFTDKFKIYGAALIFGINILYLDLLKDIQLTDRIFFHSLISIILIGVIYGGIKFRMMRFKREYEPVVNELLKIKEDLKETK